jgi:hypothetical protein
LHEEACLSLPQQSRHGHRLANPEVYAKAKEANRLNELPVNHSPKFAPVLHPTLGTGVETLVVATRAWLPA